MLKVIAAATLLATAAAHDVQIYDSDSFKAVEDNKVTLVKFYAPWCGHCKKIAPEFESASTVLLENEVVLAEVDCTADESKDVCSKYGVRGYPTLKIFRAGEDEPSDYEGGRDHEGIVKHMQKQTQAAYSVVADAEALKAMTDADSTVVAFLASEEGDNVDTIKKIANAQRNDWNFAVVTDAELTKAEGATVGQVVIYRKFDEPKVTHTGDFTKEAIEEFMSAESMPLFGEIGPENYQKYMQKGLPIAWAFVAFPATEEADASMAKIAAEYKGKISFVKLDGERWAQHGKSMGVDNVPGFVIQQERKNFLLTGDYSFEAIAELAKGFTEGTVQPNMKSQEIPEQAEDEKVVTLVGKNFEAVVFDETKDVMVEFYAPWCGHCKSLAPKYEKLAEQFADNDNVIIAKVDSTENDTPIEVSGFPTIYFFAADDNKAGVKYEGDRTEEGMSAFIEKNGKAAASATSEEAKDEEKHDEL